MAFKVPSDLSHSRILWFHVNSLTPTILSITLWCCLLCINYAIFFFATTLEVTALITRTFCLFLWVILLNTKWFRFSWQRKIDCFYLFNYSSMYYLFIFNSQFSVQLLIQNPKGWHQVCCWDRSIQKSEVEGIVRSSLGSLGMKKAQCKVRLGSA